MSQTKNAHKLLEKSRTDVQPIGRLDEGEAILCNSSESRTYAVTVSKKRPDSGEEETSQCFGQKSFISIHSTDQLCQVASETLDITDECNVEVISLNEVFPSTSEESLSNDDSSVRKQRGSTKTRVQAEVSKSPYAPSNSKSTIMTTHDPGEGQASVFPAFEIPKSTMYVMGSNPGEPKMCYPDPPKKLSKTMKKFLRNLDKHKSDQNGKSGEKALSKLTTARGILKDGRCGPECTGDSTAHAADDGTQDQTPFPVDIDAHTTYTKQNPDKNVTFNTQVKIVHFRGDLCIGQSVETLSKEKDQQARNSELRKTYLSMYNDWPTGK